MSSSLAVSCTIFLTIAARQWLPKGLRIWHIMAAGALVLLALGAISPVEAFHAIDWNVIVYLFGVFAIGAALYDSGISHAIGDRIVSARHPDLSFLVFIAAIALTSAVLTNDAAAVIGTPIALMLARALRWSPTGLLIALCATVTVGSMASPVGNPQNILIVINGPVANPVGTFAIWLAAPTLTSLAFVYVWLRPRMRNGKTVTADIADLPDPHSQPRTWPAYLGTGLLAALILSDSFLDAITVPYGVASLVGCSPIFLFSNRRVRTFREVDWPTLAFFVAMFVVTGSLVKSGSLEALLGSLRDDLSEPPVTAMIGFWASQLFSNVPVVDVYLKLLGTGETANLMMLAGISTLAGNLFIISAASNVIVVQQAEKFGQAPFTFWRFTFAVLPITVVSVAVTYGWVAWMAS